MTAPEQTGDATVFSRTDQSYDETWTDPSWDMASQPPPQELNASNPTNPFGADETNSFEDQPAASTTQTNPFEVGSTNPFDESAEESSVPSSQPGLIVQSLNKNSNNHREQQQQQEQPHLTSKPPLHPRALNQQPQQQPVQSTILHSSQIRRKKLSAMEATAAGSDDLTSTDGAILKKEPVPHQYRITVETPGAPPTDATAAVVQPIWDSSDRRQFPMLEIERMKNKTNKLRAQQQEQPHYHTAFTPGKFDPHAGLQLPIVAPSASSDGESNSHSTSSFGHSVRRRRSPRKSSPNKEGRIWSTSPVNISTDNESSLGEILDQSSADSPAVQSLQQSFNRKGQRRGWKTPSPTPMNNNNNNDKSNPFDTPSPPKAGNRFSTPPPPPNSHNNNNNNNNPFDTPSPPNRLYPVKVLPESPNPASEAPTEEMVSNDEESAVNTTLNESQDTSAVSKEEEEDLDFTLHDLCGEASSTDDIAWRNALYLLSQNPELASLCDTETQDFEPRPSQSEESDSETDDERYPAVESSGQGWTPLHIACLGMQPPPTYMTRALLYANHQAPQWRDDGGRLPLHLVAASSADVRTMELLLHAYPQAIAKRDHKGLTPLHLLLRNKSVPLNVHNVSVLLGLATHPNHNAHSRKHVEQDRFLLYRRGQHLNLTLKDMERHIQHKHKPVVTVFHPDYELDEEWDTFPPDVQVALRKLAKWERREREAEVRRPDHPRQREAEEDDEEFWSETNPAAIPHFQDLKLPIHMAVTRGIVQPEALEDLNTAGVSDTFEDEEDEDREASTSANKKERVPSVHDVYNVLRAIISAFPEGLCVRDADGLTPLLHVMTMTDGLPNLDLIELLLGKRSGAFEEIPPWLSDLPLHSITTLPASHNRFLCPAMVASARTYQLPLHIAAEEFLHDTSIVKTIYKSYPAAADVQDFRGRTPLHLVFSNYRLFPADPGIIAMLLSDSSAKTRDVEGNLPFDFLVESGESLPKALPSSWEADEMAQVYQKFFAASLMSSTLDGKKPTNPTEFLRQLRQLPPWIRRQACSVNYVQDLVIEELSSPWRTACIIFDGLLLASVLVFFRIQVKDFTENTSIWGDGIQGFANSSSVGGHEIEYNGTAGFDAEAVLSSKEISSFPVYGCIAARTMILCARAILATNIGQLHYLVLSNGWFWIDVCAMGLTFATSFLFNTLDDESALSMATGATGLLWISLIGFCATWFFGMATLLGSLSKIANQIVWPVLAGGMVLVAFAQMFYTLLWTDCSDAIPAAQVCSTRDSYRVVYLLLRGEPLVDPDGNQEVSTEAILLIAGFLVLLFLLALTILVAVVMGALHTNTEEVAFRSFWEPKLAFVLSSDDWGCKKEQKYTLAQTQKDDLQTRLDRTWDLMVSTLLFGIRSPSRTENNWYSGHRARGSALAVPMWLVAVLVVPIWFLLGLLTLGLIWPPKLRRMLFRPLGWENTRRSPSSASERAASQLSDVRSELVRVKTMSYERSVQVEREVRDIKQLLYAAMHEE